jgi:hypothetical protein
MGKSLEGPPQSIIRDLANSNPGTAAKALGQLYWIREVRKDMPKLLKALDQQERNGHRRVATKATRRTKKAARGRVAPK